ncbi:MAG: OB-fold nucleic acid binding domain-containing protein, partial [Oscillospiraceae bacterium]
LESTEKLYRYITDVTRNGVDVLPIDINKSYNGFTTESGGIRFALLAVKSLGEGTINAIIKERETNGFFKSLQDFCKRMTGKDINTRICEALIKSGAFDCFPNNRHEMLNSCNMIVQAAAQENKTNLEGQLNLFGSASENNDSVMTIKRSEEYPFKKLLQFEYETVGMYLSGHPLDEYEPIAAASKCFNINDIIENSKLNIKGFCDNDNVNVFAMLMHKKMFKTKSGTMMSFTTFEDKSGSIEVLVFPSVYEAVSGILSESNVFHIQGKLSLKEDDSPKIIAECIETGDSFTRLALQKNICVRIDSKDKIMKSKCVKIAEQHYSSKSKCRFNIYFSDLKKMTCLKTTPTVNLDLDLLKELQKTFGEKNVLFM